MARPVGLVSTRASGKTSAQGWIATARFRKGGIRAQDGDSTLTVHALNPERGTDWSVDGRVELLERALWTTRPNRGATVYLTSAGWFGCVTKKPKRGSRLTWLRISETQAEDLKMRLGQIATKLPQSTYMAVGADYSGRQELWWFQGGYSEVQITQMRAEKPSARNIGEFRVLAFICGAIWGEGGSALDVLHDLTGVDVVLDAGHASLNRQKKVRIRQDLRRWAFHRTICKIGARCGAVFSHAHGDDYRYVRNCDNWIVYRNETPFRENPEGRRI